MELFFMIFFLFLRNLLCSGSADNAIKLWDITATNCMHTYNLHKNKVFH